MLAAVNKLTDELIASFLEAHPSWTRDRDALCRTYTFASYGAGVGFAVAVAVAAEKRDHHPDIHILWRRVEVRWSTHDAGGISALDTEMAQATDALHASA